MALIKDTHRSDEHGLTLKVARGSLWSLGGQGVTLLASLITTPVVIRCLGAEAYGVLALVSVVMAYVAFSDLGMATASTRFAAEKYAHGDEEGEAAVVWTSLLVLSAPVLLMATGLVLGARTLVVHVLSIPGHLQEDCVLAFRLVAVALVARSIAGVLNTPQLVRLRLKVYNIISTGGSAGQMFLIPIVLLLGGGLVSVVAVMAAASLFTAGLHAFYSNRYLLRLTAPKIQRELVKPLLRFGASVLFILFAGTLLFHIEKPILARLGSVRELAYYAVAFTVARVLALVPGALNQSLLPAMSRLQATPNPAPLEEFFHRAIRGIVLWSLPAALLIWVLAHPFLKVWAGEEFARGSLLPLRILLVGAIFDGISYVPRALLEALGKPELVARCQMIELVPYVVAACYSIHFFGATGAATIWSLRAIAEGLWVFRAAHRVSSLSTLSVLVSPAIRTVILVAIVPVLALELTSTSVEVTGSVVVGSLTVYGVLAWRSVLTHEERVWVRNFFRNGFGRWLSQATGR